MPGPSDHGPAAGGREPGIPAWLAKIDGAICWCTRMIVAFSLAAIVVFSFGQVLDRYLLKTEFSAWTQVARIAMLWVTFLGAAVAVREHRNLTIELIEHRLPASVRVVRRYLFNLVLLVLVLLLVWKSIPVVEVGQWQSIVGTPFSYAVSYVALTIGLVLCAFFLVLRLMAPKAAPPKDCFFKPDEDTL